MATLIGARPRQALWRDYLSLIAKGADALSGNVCRGIRIKRVIACEG